MKRIECVVARDRHHGQLITVRRTIKSSKKSRTDSEIADELQYEMRMLQMLRHYNVVDCHQAELNTPHQLTLIYGAALDQHLAWYVERERWDHTRGLPVQLARDFAQQIIDALCFIHGNSQVVGNLTTESILVVESDERNIPRIQLSGFRSPATLLRNAEKPFHAKFLAPERFRGGAPTWASDIWAAGCIIYYLLSARSKKGILSLLWHIFPV